MYDDDSSAKVPLMERREMEEEEEEGENRHVDRDTTVTALWAKMRAAAAAVVTTVSFSASSNQKNKKNNPQALAAADVLKAAAAAKEQQKEEDGLEKNTMTTWTDNYFDGQDDIVAVFDHDIVALEEMELSRKVHRNFYAWWTLMECAIIIIAMLSVNSAFGDIDRLPGSDSVSLPIAWLIFYYTLNTIGSRIRRGLYQKWWQEKQEQKKNGNDMSHWPHTAVTRTGVRHAVVPLSTPSNVVGHNSYVVVDIPFADIKSIDKLWWIPKEASANATASSRWVHLALASETDGAEYVMTKTGNGRGPFYRRNPCAVALCGRKVQLGLFMSVLKEPARFQALVETLQQQQQQQQQHQVTMSSSSFSVVEKELSSRVPALKHDDGSNV
jgi:hypothetical protein